MIGEAIVSKIPDPGTDGLSSQYNSSIPGCKLELADEIPVGRNAV